MTMNVGERIDDREEAMRAMMEGRQAGTWTALPGIVQSYNATKQTVTVQPALKARVSLPDGTTREQALPVLADVPVHFPSGGGMTLTFPVAAGDECLLVFASRCIDGWFQTGAAQAPPDRRMNDLSDAFAFVGFRSVGKALSGGASTNSVQIRNDAGSFKADLNRNTGEITLTCTKLKLIGAFEQTNGNATMTGTLTAQGKIESATEVQVGARLFTSHVHSGVQPGANNTGGPV